MKVLYLITARGGSKGVPGKNLRRLGGLSLVGFKAISALKARSCSRLIISTDCPQIQAEAASFGVEVPFTRPAELASDTATSNDVILHALRWIEQNTAERYDAVMLLEPSSPFARAQDYDAAVEIMRHRQADVVLGVRPMEVNSVFVGPLDDQGRMSSVIDKMLHLRNSRRQDVPQEYTMNAALYLFRWNFFLEHGTFYHSRETTYGYPMEPEHSVEIDGLLHLDWARFLIESGKVDMSHWTWAAEEQQHGPGSGLVRKSA